VERRLPVHARPTRLIAAMTAVALVFAGAPAFAAPRSAKAKALFDKGVKAYQGKDYEAAAALLDESYANEKDAETLFAWAQAERKLDRCDRAIALWEQLLEFDLPKKNKDVARQKIAECNEVLAKQQPPPEPVAPPEPVVAPDPTPTPDPSRSRPPPPPETSQKSRWKNPVGLTLLGLGAAGLGVGTVFLFQARAADADKNDAATYEEFIDKRDTAERKGRVAVLGVSAGAIFVAAGLTWILTRSADETPIASAWVTGDGGGLALAGEF
jgi:tetratricopeptide (TPR) repeat protein